MQKIYYTMITVIILSLVTMIFHLKNTEGLKEQNRKWFTLAFLCIIAGAAAEAIGTYIDGKPVSLHLHYLITLIQFTLTPYVSVLISTALDVRRPARYLRLILDLHLLLELVMMRWGGIFTIGNEYLYHRGPYYFIYVLSYFVSVVYLISLAIVLSRRFRKKDTITLILGLGTLLLGIVPSLLDAQVETSYLGISLLAVILYIYYEDLTEQDLYQELKEKQERLEKVHNRTITGLADLIDSRDKYTSKHTQKTAGYVRQIAEKLKEKGLYKETLTDEYIDDLYKAARLHDVGKIVIPDSILKKPGRLNEEEFEIIKTHTVEGEKIITDILGSQEDDDYEKLAAEIARHHHERWDGKGYPDHLQGEEIPLCARIMAIADVYDALVEKRVYKDAIPKEKAIAMIRENAGTQFDPNLIEALSET